MKLEFVNCPVCEGQGASYREEVQGFNLNGPVLADTRYQCGCCTGGKAIHFKSVKVQFDGVHMRPYLIWADGKVVCISEYANYSMGLAKLLEQDEHRDYYYGRIAELEKEAVDNLTKVIAKFCSGETEENKDARYWRDIIGRLLTKDMDIIKVFMEESNLIIWDGDAYSYIRRELPLFFFQDPAFVQEFLHLRPIVNVAPVKKEVKEIPELEGEDLPF